MVKVRVRAMEFVTLVSERTKTHTMIIVSARYGRRVPGGTRSRREGPRGPQRLLRHREVGDLREQTPQS